MENNTEEKAMRLNNGKLRWSLVHFKSLEPMVRVLEKGAIKYAPFNWQKKMELSEILESMQRHLGALIDGEMIDPETGESHMGHIQCNAMFYNYHVNKSSTWIEKTEAECIQRFKEEQSAMGKIREQHDAAKEIFNLE